MSSGNPIETRIIGYVQRALELREASEVVDLESLCVEHPELIPAVRLALAVSQQLPESVHADPLMGTTLEGRYALDEVIGAGAMGVVYAGRDESLDRPVAIKILQHGVLATPEREQRFVREARVLASLDHPQIVKIFDHGQSERGFRFLVMERLYGVSLAAILEQQSGAPAYRESIEATTSADASAATATAAAATATAATTATAIAAATDADADAAAATATATTAGRDWLPRVATWGAEIASALASAHAAMIFHRDIKPSNIFIDRRDCAVLLDFGIATRAGDGSLTGGATTLGTPWYMAPEQALHPARVDAQVDIYGLCATLYHLVTLRPPHDGDYAQVLLRLQSEDPVPPRDLRPELPRDLCAIIEKGMERDPRRRYASMTALENDLRAFLAHLPVQARPLSPLGRRLRGIRRRPAPWIAAAVVVLAVVITTVVATNWSAAQQRESAARDARRWELFAGIPPSLAFEGSLEIRPKLDAEERSAHIGRLRELLELAPDDVYARALCAALYQDDGQHEASAREMRALVAVQPSPYLDAVVARYDAAKVDVSGILTLALGELPAPATDLDHFVAGFHLARLKDNERAERILQAVPEYLPARYLRLSVRFGLATTMRAPDARRAEFEAVRAEALALAQALGHDTARTLYFDGSSSVGLKEYAGAVRPLREAVARSVSFGSLFNLGVASRQMRQFEDSERCFRQAATLRPWNLNAVIQLAQVECDLEKFDAARDRVDAMPATGHLIEAWHRPYVMGFIEWQRCMAEYGSVDDAGARSAAEQAMEYFNASLVAAGDSRARWQVSRRVNDLNLYLDRRPELAELIMRHLRKDPMNHAYLRALARAVQHVELTPRIREELRQCLTSLGDALYPSRKEPWTTVEASAKDPGNKRTTPREPQRK